MIRRNPPHQGFTLIELLVSVAIFSIIITTASAILVAEIARERTIRQETQLQKNLYTFLEVLEREVQAAQRVGCEGIGEDCINGGDWFALENMNGEIVTYQLQDGQVVRSANGGTPVVALSTLGGQVEYLEFFVRGAVESDTRQYVLVVTTRAALSSGAKSLHAFRYITPYSFDVN